MAPRSSARTSARSGTSRDQASSPPQSSRERDTQSPLARTTRLTRSQSVEQQVQNPRVIKTKKGSRNSSREGSVESNRSIASSRGSRKRQQVRSVTTAAAARDLSIVDEGGESEEAEEDEPERSQRMHSPGVSEISGTTAVTSRSQSQLAHIDPKATDRLPDLFKSSTALLDLLIPREVTGKSVARITRHLMAPGSDLANQLKSCEDDYKMTRDHFGTEEYINNSFVLRKLFGSDEPGADFRRPDPINYLANLASLVKNFLVSQRESPRTLLMLETLHNCFPTAFASNFDENIRIGETALLDESFAIGLEIRTQYLISELAARKDEDDFHPRTILASFFYAKVPEENASQEFFDEFFDDADNIKFLRNILGDSMSVSDDHLAMVHQRVLEISESFNADIAAAAGDYIDFDQLNKGYPWSKFLTQLLEWTQRRYSEISDSITQQGGIDAIVQDVNEILEAIDSQDTDQEQDSSFPSKQEVASSALVVHKISTERHQSQQGTNYQNTKKATGSSSSAPSRAKSASTASLPQKATSQAGPSIDRSTQRFPVDARQRSPNLDDYRPDFDDGEEPPGTAPSPARREFFKAYKASVNEKNKENLAVPKAGKKRTIFDSQPDAQSIRWESQDLDSAPPPKRARFQPPVFEEEEEEEDAFEFDTRVPDQSQRKTHLSPTRDRPAKDHGHSARARIKNSSQLVKGSQTSQRRLEGARSAQPASSQGAARNNLVARRRREDSEEEAQIPRSAKSSRPITSRRAVELDSDDERPNPSQVAAAGRAAAEWKRAARNGPSRRRQAWSEADTELLIERIKEYGCAWSTIFKLGDWELERDGNALKDKACVLKAGFLKAGVPLPYNFNCIRLKSSQVRDVKAAIPNYEPEP